jgi:hypothetical protein
VSDWFQSGVWKPILTIFSCTNPYKLCSNSKSRQFSRLTNWHQNANVTLAEKDRTTIKWAVEARSSGSKSVAPMRRGMARSLER